MELETFANEMLALGSPQPSPERKRKAGEADALDDAKRTKTAPGENGFRPALKDSITLHDCISR